eukprot:4640018-Amphidinium_carterae.1
MRKDIKETMYSPHTNYYGMVYFFPVNFLKNYGFKWDGMARYNSARRLRTCGTSWPRCTTMMVA